ncbi:MAG TPA: MFS transporter [Desulfatiglandales bacterium]|nr:MFS transporter [Desulfatiglandales bacterium]
MPLFVLAHCGHHLLTALPVPLLPMIRSDFGLDYTQSGFVISAFILSYGIGQVPAGLLADRVGPRILITTGILGVAVAGFLVGLSHTYLMMIVFLVLMGLLAGGYHPAAPPLISASVRPENLGRALGLHMIGGGVSFFLAPLMAAGIGATWGWRGPFIALAAPAAVVGIVLYVILGQRGLANKSQPKATPSQKEKAPGQGRLSRLAYIIILSTFTHAALFSTTSFIPLFLVDHFLIPKTTAAALIAIIYSAGLWVGPIGGYLSDRWGRVPVILAVCFMTGPLIYLLNLAPYRWGMVVLLLVMGITIYVRMPVSEAYIVGRTSGRHSSTVLGIYFFGNMEGGGVLTPIMGYLIDHLGFSASFTIAGAAVVAVALVCSVLLAKGHD